MNSCYPFVEFETTRWDVVQVKKDPLQTLRIGVWTKYSVAKMLRDAMTGPHCALLSPSLCVVVERRYTEKLLEMFPLL